MFSKLRKTLSILLVVVFLAGLAGGFPLTVAAEEPPAPASSEVEGDSSVPPEDEGPGDEVPGEPEDPEAPDEPEAPETPEDPDPEAPDEPEAPEAESPEPEEEPAEEPVLGAAAADELPVAEPFNTEEAISEDIDSTLAKLFADPPADENPGKRADVLPLGNRFEISSSEVLSFGYETGYNTFGAYETRLYGHAAESISAAYGDEGTQRNKMHASYKGDYGRYLWPINIFEGDYTTAYEGDFDGSGRDDDFAMIVYCGDGDKDITTERMSQHTINIFEGSADPTRTSGEPYAYYNGNAVMNLIERPELPAGHPAAKYTVHEADNALELHLRTGDVNGDGRDEIIVLIPNYNDITGATARLVVYTVTGTDAEGYREWGKLYDQAVGIGFGRWETTIRGFVEGTTNITDLEKAVRRTHSLAVGDLDGDGRDDIAITSNEFTFYALSGLDSAEEPLKDEVRTELQLLYSIGTGFTSQTYSYNNNATTGNTLYGDTTAGALLELPTLENVGVDGKGGSLATEFPIEDSNKGGNYGRPENSFYYKSKNHALYPTDLGVEIVDADGKDGAELLLGYLLTGACSSKVQDDMYPDRYTDWYRNYGYIGYRANVLKESGARALEPRRSLEYLPYLQSTAYGGLLYGMTDLGGSTSMLAIMPFTRHQYRPRSYCYPYVDFVNAAMGAVRLTAANIANLAEQKQGGYSGPEIIVGGRNLHNWNATTGSYAVHSNLGDLSMIPDYPICNPHNDDRYMIQVYGLRPTVMHKKADGGTLEPLYGFTMNFRHERLETTNDRTVGWKYTSVVFASGGEVPYASGSITGTQSFQALRSSFYSNGYSDKSYPSFFCLPDTDYDKITAEFVDYSLVHTDPVVVAAVAAAPFHEDLAAFAVKREEAMGTTTYGKSSTQGSSEVTGKTTNSGQYFSTEISVGAEFKIGAAEFGLAAVGEYGFEHTITKNTEKTHTTEVTTSVTYSTTGEDMVVLHSYPVDTYNYELTYPVDAAGTEYTTSPYSINFPYAPREATLTLEQYNDLYALYPDILPDLDREVFTHEVGYPETYVRTTTGYKTSKEKSFTKSSSNLDVAVEMQYDTTNEIAVSTENGWDHQAGGGIKGSVKAGSVVAVSVESQTTAGKLWGHSNTTGSSSTESEGVIYGGSVINTGESNVTEFDWQLAHYNYYGKQNFPVLTYLVTPTGTRHLRLPEVYEAYDALTTHETVGLRWQPSRDDNNPGPNSNVKYIVSTSTKAAPTMYSVVDNLNYSYDPSTGYYSVAIGGKVKATHYRYHLQVSPANMAGGTDTSVYTPAIVVTTNPSETGCGITLQPKDLTIFSGDGNGKLLTSFDKGDFTGDIDYQWMRLKDRKWYNLSDDGAFAGTKTNELRFPNPLAGLAGTYRLQVAMNWIAGSEVQTKHFLSEPAEVTFSREAVSMELLPAEAVVTPAATYFDADVREATYTVQVTETATGNTTGLGGYVLFALTSPPGGVYYQSAEVDSVTGKATTTYRLYSEGAYSIKATYLGDKLHEAGVSVTDTKVKGATGTDASGITLKTDFEGGSYLYGEEKSIVVEQYRTDNGIPTVNPMNLVVTLQKYKEPQATNTKGSWEPVTDTPGELPWVTKGAYELTLNFKKVGKYKLTIRAGEGALADTRFDENGKEIIIANTITRTFTIVPRPITYKVRDVLRYQDRLSEQGISIDDLHIELAPGSLLLAGTDSFYTKADLGVYNGSTQVNGDGLNDSLAPGSYTIRPITVKSDPNYDIKVQNGTYIIVKASDSGEAAKYFSVEFYSGDGSAGTMRVIQPLGLQSNERAPQGSRVTFEAIPFAGYVVTGWRFYLPGDRMEETAANGNFFTTPELNENCTVVALFGVAADAVTKVRVSPSAAAVIPGGQQQFSATVIGGQSKAVRWSVAGSNDNGTFIDKTGLLTVSKNETKELTVQATSVENPGVSGSATVTLKPSDVVSVTLNRVNANIPRGTSRQFTADVEVLNDASKNVVWSVSGSTSPGTDISRSGLLTVSATESVGARLTVRAAAEADTSEYDEQVLLVTDDGTDDELALAQSHLALEAGSDAAVSVGTLPGVGVQPGSAQVYPMHTDRSAPPEDRRITAEIVPAKIPLTSMTYYVLMIKQGTAEAGDSFTVRVTAMGRPAQWAECRVDVIPAAPSTPTDLEQRITAKTIEVNAYSTANIVVPVARVVNSAKIPWSLLADDVQVSLADSNHRDLLDAFKPELVKIDESNLRLVPLDSNSMESLKSSYKNVKLKLTYKGDDSDSAQAVLASGFTLKVSKKLPTVKAQTVTLDTWAGSASGTPLFTGATVTKLEGNLTSSVDRWLQFSGTRFTAAQGAKGSATVKLTATLKGWTKTVSVKIPVKATNTAPGLKLKTTTAKLYHDYTLSSGITMQLLPKNKSDTLIGMSVNSVEVDEDSAGSYAVTDFNRTDGTFILKALKNPSRETIWLQVYFTGVRASTVMKLPVKVRPVTSAIKLKPASTKVALNTMLGDSYSLPLTSNIADLNLSHFYIKCELPGNDNAHLEEPTVLSGNSAVLFSTGPNTEAPKSNKYTLKLWRRNPGSDTSAKPLHSVTVQVSTKSSPATVSLAAKGKLDISKIAPAPVTLTAKFKSFLGGYTSGYENVKFAVYYKNGKTWELKYDESKENSGDQLFEIRRTSANSMSWHILPVSGVALTPGSYRIGITTGGISGGRQILTSVKSEDNLSAYYTTFTVTASKPKVVAAQTATLYRTDSGSERVVRLRLPDGYQGIRKLELKNGDRTNMCYAVKYLGNGKVAIHFNPAYTDKRSRTAAEAAKSSTLTLNLWLEGNGKATQLTTTKVKVIIG